MTDHRSCVSFCVLTPSGPAAIAVIALWGEDVTEWLTRLLNPSAGQIPVGEFRLVRWKSGSEKAPGAAPGEEVLLGRPEETAFEIHCHGGTIAARRISDDLLQAGAAGATQASWLARKMPWYVVRCQLALSRCTTSRVCELVMEQQRAWTRLLGQFMDAVPPALGAAAEIARQGLAWNRGSTRFADKALVRFASLLEPVSVVLFGPPNAGKSSLLNSLAGFTRSIVHHEAGTTRDVVTCATAFGGWPVRLSDTAGLRSTGDAIERAGADRTEVSLATAGLRVLVIDSTEWPAARDWERWYGMQPDLVLANKADLQAMSPHGTTGPVLSVSARTGDGIGALTSWLEQKLSERLPPADLAVPLDNEMDDWLILLEQALATNDVAAVGKLAAQALAVGR